MRTDDIRRRYDGAAGADHIASEFFREKILLGGWMRKRIFGRARGRILDVACGTGENFTAYRQPGSTFTAIELSAVMLEAARERARRLGMTVILRVMDAQHLEFADASFDTVVSAMSTCTFPDPAAALHEMRRVCKPGGRILLFEHGRSTWGPIARWQDRTVPQMYARAGCRANQDPLAVVRTAGLNMIRTRRALLGVFHLIEVSPQ
jgi:ubiquinone/menaquinone biosynthesis C-methylase UbiE